MNKQAIRENNGQISSTRIIFIIGIAWSMLFVSAMTFVAKWSPGEIIAVFSSLSGVFIGLKLGQKPMESKTKINIESDETAKG